MNEETFFLPYQKKWINDNSRLKIIEKSRQIGISLATAYRLVKTHSCKGVRYDAWVSSRDEIQAKLFLNDCRRFGEILHVAAKEYGQNVVSSESKIGATPLRFKNGKAIYSMSSNPDAQAGKRGTRVLDEFALHPYQRELYSIAYPGITWGGQLEIVSTHRGTQTFFYHLLRHIVDNGNPQKFSHHKVTLQDALEQGFLRKLQQKLDKNDPIQSMSEGDYFDFVRRSCPDEESFRQEYMCEPADDQSVFLSPDLIEAAEENYAFYAEKVENCSDDFELFLGVDIGRVHDLTVFWLIAVVGNHYVTKDIVVLKDKTFSEQEQILYQILSLPKLCRVCIDQTGIGRQFSERAEEFWGKYKVEGITFTNGVKEQLAYQLRSAFEDRRVKIPEDETLRSDLRSIRKENTITGKVRFAADSSEIGHADRFWALALAIHAVQNFKPSRESFFINIPRSKNEYHFKNF